MLDMRSRLLICDEFFEAFDAAPSEAQRGGFIGVVDPEAAVLGHELVGDFVEQVYDLAEYLGRAGMVKMALGAAITPSAVRALRKCCEPADCATSAQPR